MINFMKKNLIFLGLVAFLAIPTVAYSQINTVFIDIEAIFETDKMKASSYIGKIASLRYLSQVGNLPCQEDLFNHLKPIKALSKQVTYNNNLELPLILSDWLTSQQATAQIKNTIQSYLANHNLSDIEIKVLMAVITMMLTPNYLADAQKIRPKMEQFLQKLKQHGYKIYIVGNWANIQSMQQHFPEIFKYCSGSFISADLHITKPQKEFYSTIQQTTKSETHQSLWIETEYKFYQRAQQAGLHTLHFGRSDNYTALLQKLKQFNINI